MDKFKNILINIPAAHICNDCHQPSNGHMCGVDLKGAKELLEDIVKNKLKNGCKYELATRTIKGQDWRCPDCLTPINSNAYWHLCKGTIKVYNEEAFKEEFDGQSL